MLTPAEILEFANRPPDTGRTPADVIRAFLDMWIASTKERNTGNPVAYKQFLLLCMRSWITKPTLQDGFPVEPMYVDNMLQGTLEAYDMDSYEPFDAPAADGDELTVPVIVHFSVPIYPDPEKEEFYMKPYRRKMILRCAREADEWGLDPNSLLEQDCA